MKISVVVFTFILAILGATAQTPPPFAVPMSDNIQLDRLAKTPVLDGKWTQNEWELFYENSAAKTGLQWDEGALYASAVFSADKVFVISLDVLGDGWLSGNDNVEIMVKPEDKENCSVRVVSAGKGGPAWMPYEIIAKNIAMAVNDENGTRTVEMAIPDMPDVKAVWKNKKNVFIRIDAVSPDIADRPAYEPRSSSKVNLVQDIPITLHGVEVKIKPSERYALRGQNVKIDVEVKNKTVELFPLAGISVEGEPNAFLSLGYSRWGMEPLLGMKSAVQTHRFGVPENSQCGTIVATTTMKLADGSERKGKTSITVGEPIILTLNLKSHKVKLDKNRRFTGEATIECKSRGELRGKLLVMPPPGFVIVGRNDKEFVFTKWRWGSKTTMRFVLEAPADSTGMFRLRAQASLKDSVISRELWIELSDSPATP